jgi:queuine tRNA-ribosyltransferase
MLGAQLNTIHNLRYYQKLMEDLREAVAEGRLDEFADEFYAQQATPNP